MRQTERQMETKINRLTDKGGEKEKGRGRMQTGDKIKCNGKKEKRRKPKREMKRC